MVTTTSPISLVEISVQQKNQAKNIIKRHTLYAAGLGFIPIPVVDALSITGIQIWMIRDIAKVYEIPFKRHLVKSFIGTVVGNLGAVGVVKFIPGLGSVLGGATVSVGAATATYALGQLFMEHFNQGGTLLDFDPVKSRAYFQKLYAEHETTVNQLREEEQKQVSSTTNKSTALADVATSSNEEELKGQELYAEQDATVNQLQKEGQQELSGITDKSIALAGVATSLKEEALSEQEQQHNIQEIENGQQTDNALSIQSQEEEIVENDTTQYADSGEQLEQALANLQQEAQEKEVLQKQIKIFQVYERQHKQEIQNLETHSQRQQKNLSVLRQELRTTEEIQKRTRLRLKLLPLLLLLLGWIAGLTYGKRTSNNTVPQEQTQEQIQSTDSKLEALPIEER